MTDVDVQTEARSALELQLEPCQKHEQEGTRPREPAGACVMSSFGACSRPSRPQAPRNAQRAAWRETLSGVLTKTTQQEWVDQRTTEMQRS